MADHGHHSNHGSHGKAYETTDASIRAISISGVWVFITVFVAMGLMGAMIWAFMKMPPPMDRKPTASEMQRVFPQGPRLQVDEPGDLAKFRAREDQFLNSYGRQPNSGAVRIPVHRAIELIAERGLGSKPAVEAAKPAAAAPPKPEPPKPAGGAKPAH